MNKDQKLTALAAKAVGIEHPGGNHAIYDDGRLWDCNRLCWWNPIHDDGDALRLAVKLELEFYVGDDEGRKASYVSYFSFGLDRARIAVEKHEDHKDANKATRRAIVRAAAEIGKAMP